MIELVTISVIITFIIFFVCMAIFSYIWDKKTSKQDKKSSNDLFEEYVMDKEAIKQDADESEIKIKDNISDIEPQIVEAKLREIDHSRYMPKDYVGECRSDLSDEVIKLLMSYDNARLKEIIENPLRYNPAVVEKAGMLLRRRLAWEQIKDVSDKELLAMAMAIRGLYDENIVEAASMELYQRDSQLLREQFMLMMPDDVSSIASGTAPAPEGIRLAAQKYLSQK